MTGNNSFLLPHVKNVIFRALAKNCISAICGHYHGNMQLYRDFLGVNLKLHISTTFCIHINTILANLLQKNYNNKHMCTKEFRVNRRLTHSEEGTSLKALSNPTLPPILWFLSDFQISIDQHCLTGIPKLETFDESVHGTCMSTDNKRQLILFDVNWPTRRECTKRTGHLL